MEAAKKQSQTKPISRQKSDAGYQGVGGQKSEAGRRWTRKMIVDERLEIFYTCAGLLMPLTNKA